MGIFIPYAHKLPMYHPFSGFGMNLKATLLHVTFVSDRAISTFDSSLDKPNSTDLTDTINQYKVACY